MDLVSLGEILMDMFPAEVGKKLGEVSAFYPKPGGACANVAVAASRLGCSSAFIGKVGEDAFGHVLIQTLAENGVETRGMRLDEVIRTTVVFIAMPDENHAEFIFFRNPGADLRLRADELDVELLSGCKVLHVGSLTLVDEPAREAQYRAIELARKNGALISFDVNFRPNLWQERTDALREIDKMLALTDLLKVNETELELLTGSSDPALGSAALLKKGVQLVAVTLGTQGSYYQTQAHCGHVAPFAVQTVDAVGCGDAFIAGLITAFIRESLDLGQLSDTQLARCFRYANAVGALTALTRGVIPALPTADQVEKFLKQNS